MLTMMMMKVRRRCIPAALLPRGGRVRRMGSWSRETELASAGCFPVGADGDVTPPIQLATTFERAQESLEYESGHIYGRLDCPTRQRWERAMCDLEGARAVEAYGVASGMHAYVSLVLAQPKATVLLPDDIYHGVREISTVLRQWGMRTVEVDMTDLAAVERALVQVRGQEQERGDGESAPVMLWLETPSNPLCKITDVSACVGLARNVLHEKHKRALLSTVVDATWLPLMQQGLDLGADFVMHSATKYLGGHSDSTAGVVVRGDTPVADRIAEQLRVVQIIGGGVASPFDSWLILRGMRSLAPRMAAHCDSAQAVAEFLESHPCVEQVLYPGLPSHPQHAVAKRQMRKFGGMLSILVKGGRNEAQGVVGNVQLFRRATSLGGTESLIERRREIEGEFGDSPENLLRLSIGLEAADDINADLDRALRAACGH